MQKSLKILSSNYGSKINRSKSKFGKALLIIFPMVGYLIAIYYFTGIPIWVKASVLLALGFVLNFFLRKSNQNMIDEINDQSIGDIELTDDKLRVKVNNAIVDINSESNHSVVMYLNSYLGEVNGFGSSKEFFFGTDSTIAIRSDGKEEKFYIFLSNKEDYASLQSISSWCFENKIDIKEYTNTI